MTYKAKRSPLRLLRAAICAFSRPAYHRKLKDASRAPGRTWLEFDYPGLCGRSGRIVGTDLDDFSVPKAPPSPCRSRDGPRGPLGRMLTKGHSSQAKRRTRHRESNASLFPPWNLCASNESNPYGGVEYLYRPRPARARGLHPAVSADPLAGGANRPRLIHEIKWDGYRISPAATGSLSASGPHWT